MQRKYLGKIRKETLEASYFVSGESVDESIESLKDATRKGEWETISDVVLDFRKGTVPPIDETRRILKVGRGGDRIEITIISSTSSQDKLLMYKKVRACPFDVGDIVQFAPTRLTRNWSQGVEKLTGTKGKVTRIVDDKELYVEGMNSVFFCENYKLVSKAPSPVRQQTSFQEFPYGKKKVVKLLS